MKIFNKIRITIMVTTLLSVFGAFAQSPELVWQYNYGGSEYDGSFDIISTSDGGLLVAGHSESSDGDVNNNNGEGDIWLLKTDATGHILWTQIIGGNGYDIIEKLFQTSDDGFILAGTTGSTDGEFSNNNGNYDALVIKMDLNGNIQWLKNYGGQSNESARNIIQTTDGGYVFIADSDSADGDLTQNLGGGDMWIVKLDSDGVIEWQRVYGGSDHDYSNGLLQNTMGNYMVSGYTFSNDIDVSQNFGGADVWAFEITPIGNILWKRTFGGSNFDYGMDIKGTTDGGYMVAGGTLSIDGDVTENAGGMDAWVIKLDAEKNVQWQKTYGGSSDEIFKQLKIIADSGFIASGTTNSTDGDISTHYGNDDIWWVVGDDNGILTWEKSLGGSGDEDSGGIIQTLDGNYIGVGSTTSLDGDLTGNNGFYDLWIYGVQNSLNTNDVEKINFQIFPNPVWDIVNIKADKTIKSVEIYDSSSRSVMSSTPNTRDAILPIKDFKAGFYFITLELEGGLYYKKILKN